MHAAPARIREPRDLTQRVRQKLFQTRRRAYRRFIDRFPAASDGLSEPAAALSGGTTARIAGRPEEMLQCLGPERSTNKNWRGKITVKCTARRASPQNVCRNLSCGRFAAKRAAPVAFEVAPAVISDKESGSAVPTKQSDCPSNAKPGSPNLKISSANISGGV